MISATFMIAAILTAVLLIVSLILVKATPAKSYLTYFPGILSFAAGLIFLLFATLIDRIWIMGAGLGGWGIACLFAAGITLMVIVVFDSFRQVENA
ncbi:MAG TPA: hypothetical protein VK108_04495 [Pseudogracilibacillus sp.]|nr:hypothetical protein [Pseudogracilibacillus sp.]